MSRSYCAVHFSSMSLCKRYYAPIEEEKKCESKLILYDFAPIAYIYGYLGTVIIILFVYDVKSMHKIIVEAGPRKKNEKNRALGGELSIRVKYSGEKSEQRKYFTGRFEHEQQLRAN
ncbi:CLUMA_CG001842, isoform A [Clunio marinus]|uniref:CLUMA_CG001842, isoform A n=1 Tax=Clunio marinus TaxID=568069 RepID=A0A1J1HPB9_9DIPT|nr:CLUMA_CG001842, isoform A [Clunio marinus]